MTYSQFCDDLPSHALASSGYAAIEWPALWTNILGWNLALAGVIARGRLV